MRAKKNILSPTIFIILISFLGGLMRFYNLNWDEKLNFHPDERNVVMAVTRISFFDQLDPKFFAYGGFTIYLYRAAAETLAWFTKNGSWLTDWGNISLIGRHFSALVSTLSIFLVYILARKLFNLKTALYATILSAFVPGLIQSAHFAVTESFLVSFALLICIFSLRIINQKKTAAYITTAFFLGLAVATKISALAFLVIPISAHLLTLTRKHFLRKQVLAAVAVVAGLSIFMIFSPYTLLNREKFFESMRYEHGVVKGTLPVPYTLQFTNTIPFLYQLVNLPWLVGLNALTGVSALILLFLIALKTRNKNLLVFLSFPILYFLYVGSWHAKFVRYLVPLIPFLIIASGWFLERIEVKLTWLGKAISFFVIFTTVVWGISFFSIYTKTQTRIEASYWIYKNIPRGSTLYTEHWDDGLPVPLSEGSPNLYKIEQLTIYEPDNFQKALYYADKLASGEYIILSSRRLWGTLTHLPDMYPITSNYYKLLFSGKLGYFQIASFSSYPEIFGVSINDDASEETFQVYDHPTVLIFKKFQKLSKGDILNMLYDK